MCRNFCKMGCRCRGLLSWGFLVGLAFCAGFCGADFWLVFTSVFLWCGFFGWYMLVLTEGLYLRKFKVASKSWRVFAVERRRRALAACGIPWIKGASFARMGVR